MVIRVLFNATILPKSYFNIFFSFAFVTEHSGLQSVGILRKSDFSS